MKNYMSYDSKALANVMIDTVESTDSMPLKEQGPGSVYKPQQYLHYLAAKRLGFPVTIRGNTRGRDDLLNMDKRE